MKLIVGFLNFFLICEQAFAVIYDQDTRQDLTSAQVYSQAQATAALIKLSDLKQDSALSFIFRKFSLKQAYPLCETEKFLEQSVLAFCSGVLIGPQQVLTAGHCVRDQKHCSEIAFTFGFTQEKSQLGVLSSKEIYTCQKLIARDVRVQNGGADYAVVQLDRIVTKIKPVQVAAANHLKERDAAVSFSYPLGLPLKADSGFVIRNEAWSKFFEVAIDTFAGSSGSGIFNSKGHLVGILTSGSDDFLEDDIRRVQTSGGCIEINRCQNGTCRGERFFKVEHIPLR